MSPTRSRRAWLWLELGVVVLGVLVLVWDPAAWLVERSWRRPIRVVSFGVIGLVVVGSVWRLGETRQDWGLGGAGLRCGWRSMLWFTVGSLAVLVVAARLLGDQLDLAERGRWLAGYLPGMVLQQLALQLFLNNRVYYLAGGEERRRRRRAVFWSCAVFVLLHAPNPGLMLAVAWAGGYWCWHFRAHRNLLAVMLSHGVLGTAAMALLGERWLWHLRVGYPALPWLRQWVVWLGLTLVGTRASIGL